MVVVLAYLGSLEKGPLNACVCAHACVSVVAVNKGTQAVNLCKILHLLTGGAG